MNKIKILVLSNENKRDLIISDVDKNNASKELKAIAKVQKDRALINKLYSEIELNILNLENKYEEIKREYFSGYIYAESDPIKLVDKVNARYNKDKKKVNDKNNKIRNKIGEILRENNKLYPGFTSESFSYKLQSAAYTVLDCLVSGERSDGFRKIFIHENKDCNIMGSIKPDNIYFYTEGLSCGKTKFVIAKYDVNHIKLDVHEPEYITHITNVESYFLDRNGNLDEYMHTVINEKANFVTKIDELRKKYNKVNVRK